MAKPERIGFSHGVLYRIFDIYSEKAINLYGNRGRNAIEVCLNKASDLGKIDAIKTSVSGFDYKSIHLPTNIAYKNNAETERFLDRMENFYREIDADLILVHPDIVEDWKIFDGRDLNWAVENMDNRKDSFRTFSDLSCFFKKMRNWKFVLDLNHCYSNDASMKLAEEFFDRLGNKIAQIHLSGYEKYHEPLFKTKQNIILDYCQKANAPIIIESAFDSVEDLEKEYAYIISYLKKN